MLDAVLPAWRTATFRPPGILLTMLNCASALSLLASAGIGIFNHRHFIIDSAGTCQKIMPSQGGTHRFVWSALKYWSSLSSASQLVGDSITPRGIPLFEWIKAFPRGGGLGLVASNWLTSFGLDLDVFVADRDARDAVSYAPSRLVPLNAYQPPLTAAFVSDLWRLVSPLQNSCFDLLDRYLLRRSLDQIAKGTPNMAMRKNEFIEAIKRMLVNVNLSSDEAVTQTWAKFLSRELDAAEPTLLVDADTNAPPTDVRHHVQVLSRAALLLRIATGSCASLISSAFYSSTDLEFWWRPFGYDLGLWEDQHEPGTAPGDITDLWEGVQDALDDLAQWQTAQKASLAQLRSQQAKSLWRLAECERIALWGLIP